MKTCDKDDTKTVYYQFGNEIDSPKSEGGSDLLNLYYLSGNKNLLIKFLEQHKEVIKPVGVVKEATLNTVGEEVTKEIKLRETIVTCEDISPYIL
jgi:hypothetical protein